MYKRQVLRRVHTDSGWLRLVPEDLSLIHIWLTASAFQAQDIDDLKRLGRP